MNKTGLCSISFRNLSVDEIILIIKKANLDGIEWGGDVHSIHGKIKLAEEIRKKTLNAGLCVSSYGSYYRTGISESENLLFKDVLASAVSLGAPIIRVWAGNKNYADYDINEVNFIIKDIYRICEMAENENISIAFEYHGGTLTNCDDGVKKLQEMTQEIKNLSFYWQPPVGLSIELCLNGINYLKNIKKLSNIHVFQWDLIDSKIVRKPLIDGKNVWERYIGQCGNDDRYFLMEFVKNDNTEQFYADAKFLKGLLK